ncbi:hypothetical protein FJTKL_06169 [Diaporthe vaccinii]|uniref:Ubiquitin-like domain-containing protein n=1 Tax=Diaporthe vaccinii TaxID=105482 RepID=A0ABR4EXK2_9PEZI
MADMRVGSSIQATVALGQKLASLLQMLIELNPSSQKDFKDMHFDIEATSGTLRQLQDLIGNDEAIGFERNTKPAVTSSYLDEIETLAVKCGLIYKSIMLITQKAGVREKSRDGGSQASSLENLKTELLTGPIPDPGSVKSIKVVRIPSKFDQQEWLEPRIARCQEQLQWIRTGLLIHLHILKLAQLQNGSVERNTGDFENELMYRSSIQLLRQRQVKFTKKKSRKQEKAQRKWELERKADNSDTESVTSVATSASSSVTASTAVDDAASVSGKRPAEVEVVDVVDSDKKATDANQGETKSLGDVKVTESEAHSDTSKTLRSFTLKNIGSDLPAYFFDWKQRIFGTDDKFKTDWPSTNLEAYIRHNSSFGKPTKVPFGHKRLHYGLNKIIKDGQKEKSTWNRYVDAEQVTRLAIDEIVDEANRHQSRERICVAFQEYNKEGDDPFILVFLSLRKEPQPISFKDAVGRNYTLPFETCRKWDAMKATIIEAFNHVEVIGPHVVEGHFDLLTSNGEIMLPHLWSTTIKPGAVISMKMWPKTPLRGLYGPPPFTVNPHAPNPASHAMTLRMRQMQAQRMAAMRHPPPPMRPPPHMGGMPPMGVPPPPPGLRSFPAPRKVTVVDWRSEYDISEKEDEQLMFVNFVEELEKIKTATVADLLRKFTTLKDVMDEDSLGDFLAVDSDYDSDDSGSTSSSTELIND